MDLSNFATYTFNGETWYILQILGAVALAVRAAETGGDYCTTYVIPYEQA